MVKKKGTKMKELILNETPVRTSRNFNINNIKIENISIPTNIESFKNVEIIGQTPTIKLEEFEGNGNLTYGLGDFFTNQVKEKANQKLKLTIDSKINKEIEINFKFNEQDLILIDNIEIVANENSRATVIIKYETLEDIEGFHNGIIRLVAKKEIGRASCRERV